MTTLTIAPIVEGHGEFNSIRLLLQRIGFELLGDAFFEVLQPIRRPRDRLVQNKDGEIHKAVELAVGKLRQQGDDSHRLVLLLIDADQDLPCALGPALLQQAVTNRKDQDIACVIANVEYETWFVAAAESLAEFLDLSSDDALPNDPERQRCGKSWVEKRFKGVKYSETVDQPKLTAAMDLAMCRSRSASFDKLCRELEKRVPPSASAEGK